jgi:hypothetical protein
MPKYSSITLFMVYVDYSHPMSGTGTRLELYVRSLAPRGRRSHQAAVLDRLQTLSMNDEIADYEVYVCGKRLPANPEETRTEFGAYLHNRIAVFELWAAQNEIPLESLFRRQRIDSTLSGESAPELIVPTMLLAEYEGTALQFVAPCETEHRSWSVADRLKRIDGQEAQDDTEPLDDALEGTDTAVPTGFDSRTISQN